MAKYDKELAFAKEFAYKAGRIMKKYYRIDQHVETKADNTPITTADIEVNDAIIEAVQAKFPKYGLLGEEASWEADRNRLWVCDPIDGTPAFIFHIPTSMFSLALVIDGMPVVAVTYNPFTGDVYEATVGRGARLNGETIHVSNRKWGPGLRLAGSSSGTIDGVAALQETRVRQGGVKVIQSYGAVFKGCLVAEGSLDGRIFLHSGAHDIAAIKLIIEEAGGKVTDLEGKEQRYDRQINGAVMSNGHIHEELLKLL